MPPKKSAAQVKLEHILELNNSRQRMFYTLNNQRILQAKKEKYKEKQLAKGINVTRYNIHIEQQELAQQAHQAHQAQIQEHHQAEIQEQQQQEENEAPEVYKGKKKYVPKEVFKYDKNQSYKTFDDIYSKLNDKNEKSHLNTLFKILGNPDNYLQAIMKAQPVLERMVAFRQDTGRFKGKPYAINSLKSFIQILVITITRLSLPVPPSQQDIYQSALKVKNFESDNVSAIKQKTLKVPTFASYIARIKTKYKEGSKQWVMTKLYQEITMRDDFHLKIIRSEGDDSKNIKDQYLVVPEDETKPLTIIINHYKTDNRYGVIKVICEPALSKILRTYIKATKLQYGKYLFPLHNSAFVSKMNKAIGENKDGGVGITLFRQMKVSEIASTSSAEERVLLSNRMGHSPLMSLKYIRLLRAEDFPNPAEPDAPEVLL